MNNHNNILLINPKFDPAIAKSCCLLIKVDFDSFSYAIVNKETKQVIALFDEQECDGAQKLAERLKIDNYLSLPYEEIKLAFFTENHIAVPDDFYNENDVAIHTQFFVGPHTDNLYAQKQTHFKFTNLFSLSQTADETANNYFADGKKYIGNAGLLKLAEKIDETTLLIDFSVNSFKIIYVEHQKLVFQQNYEIANTDEFNYYLLLIVNQIAINSKQAKVLLSGIIHQEDLNYICLQKYFSEIAFLSIENILDLEVLNDLPTHYYTSLLALYPCE